MKKISFFLAIFTFVFSSFSYADDKNGNFPTDILAAGNSYFYADAFVYSENSNLLNHTNEIGKFKRNYTDENFIARYGLYQNIDVSFGVPIFSDYKSRTFYTNGPTFISNKREGLGNLAFSGSYGIINEKTNPLSLKISLTGTPNNSGNETGSVKPSLDAGYQLNERARLYSGFSLTYTTNDNYANYNTVKFGWQYDIIKNLTIDVMANHSRINSVNAYKSYDENNIVVKFIYGINDRLYVLPSFENVWHSDIASKNNLITNQSTSQIRLYSIALKYLFN